MKTILHITEILPYGKLKSNNVLFEIANRMRHKYKFKFIRLIPYSNYFLGLLRKKWKIYSLLPDIVRQEGFDVFGFKMLSLPFNSFKVLTSLSIIVFNNKRLGEIIKDVDIVHAHYTILEGCLAYYIYRRWGIPYTLTFRDETGLLKYNLPNRFLSKLVWAHATCITCISEYARKRMRKYIRRKIKLIPHGIDKELLSEDITKNDKVKLFSAGDLIKLKNIDVAIKALALLNSEGYEDKYEYRVAGAGHLGNYYRTLAAKLKVQVRFLGRLTYDGVQGAMRESDIFILPSRPESFGRVYLEAMAKHNAVIAAVDSGIDGLFENGVEVFNVEPTEQKVKEKLKYLLDNPEKMRQMKKAAYSAVKERFTWAGIISMYGNMYDSVGKLCRD